MKFLQDYQEEKQTELFNRLGSFFAFSMKQFNEAKKDGMKYVNLGAGLITPKGTEEELITELDRIYKDAINQDVKENGKDAIIRRELYNHEATYTGDISSTVDALQHYPIMEAEIFAVFQEIMYKENQ